MMPDQVRKFMESYGVTKDEVWPVPGGKAYAIKHSALERIAAAQRIWFEPPTVIEAHGEAKIATLLVVGHMGDRGEWTFGEAAPANNKNAYPFAMAEKRAKDRLILKLLNAHGAIYSEDEFAETPRQSSNAVKKNNPEAWPELEKAVRAATTRDELTALWREKHDLIRTWPLSWQEQAEELFRDRVGDMAVYEAAE